MLNKVEYHLKSLINFLEEYSKIYNNKKINIEIIEINTFSNGIVHQYVPNATPSKPTAINAGVRSRNRRVQ
jgi:hypothetical protein